LHLLFIPSFRADSTFLYAESAANPVDPLTEQGVDLEEHFKTVSEQTAALINDWISSPSSLPEAVTTALESYDYPRVDSLAALVAFKILRMKKKSNKGVEISYGVSTAVSNESEIPEKSEVVTKTTTPSPDSAPKTTDKTPQPIVKRSNPTKAQATRIVDKTIPDMVAAMSACSLDFTDIATIVVLEKNLHDAEVNTKVAGTKGKQGKAAKEALDAARNAYNTFPAEKMEAYMKVKSVMAMGLLPELTMFKNEAYTEGLQSVKDRDRLSHNPRR